MTGPRDIIRQASARRSATPQNNHAPAPMTPAPLPMTSAAGASAAETRKTQVAQWRTPPLMTPVSAAETGSIGKRTADEQTRQEQIFRAVPQNIGGHAVYRELMRSHDRMGTRHIGKGG